MRIALKLVSYLFIFLLLCISTLIALAYIYEDDIKAYAVEQVNQKIETKISTGNIQVSFLRNFPYASITFPNIVVESSSKKGPLLQAQELSFLFNIKDVLSGNYQILKLIAADGELNISYYTNGSNNFSVLKSTEQSSDKSVFLNYLSLQNIAINYKDQANGIDLKALVNELSLDGNISSTDISGAFDGDWVIVSLQNNTKTLLTQKPISLQSNIAINPKKQRFDFAEVRANYNGLYVSGNMNLAQQQGKYHLKATLNHQKIACTELLNVLDIQAINFLKTYIQEGKVEGVFFFNGPIDDEYPNFEWKFNLDKGVIDLDGRKFYCSTNAIINAQTKGKLILDNLEFEYSGVAFKGKASLTQLFVQPLLQAQLNADFNIKQFKADLPKQYIEDAVGNVRAAFVFEGDLTQSNNIQTLLKKASFSTSNLTISGSGYKYLVENCKGNVVYDQDHLLLDGFQFSFNQSPVVFSGKINQAEQLLFSEKDVHFSGSFKLNFEEIDLPFLLYAFSSSGKEASNSSDLSKSKFSVNSMLDITIEVNAKRFTYNKISGKNLNLSAEIQRGRISVPYYEFDAMGGSFSGNGNLKAVESENINILNLNTSIYKTNIRQLFSDFNNFGQGIIKAENIDGILNAQIQCSLQLSKTLDVNVNSINAIADIEVLNGSLTNVKSLESLSRYIKLEDLKNIQFENLSNQIIIKDKLVTIPMMNVKNSAIDLVLSGTHSFSNEIEYKITVLFSDILDRKIRFNKNLADVGVVSDDEKNQSVVFLKMYGTVDEPKVEIDREKMKMGLNQKLKQEKETLKSIFKEEFGGKNTEKPNVIPEDPSMMQPRNYSTQGNTTGTNLEQQKQLQKDTSQKKGLFKKLKDNINTPIEDEN
jgi:hypothetical protein